jgi:L,D-transpeptidase YbiS
VSARVIEVSIAGQRLRLCEGARVLREYRVSTGRNGPGELADSLCTPRGWHVVRAKIGAGAAPGAVFVGRRPTGEIWSAELRARYPQRDWILTRILWLSGLEPGRNRLGRVDTMRRYVYIHGTPDDVPMGVPASHGCVRMRNADVVELFDAVPAGTRVLVLEGGFATAERWSESHL